MNQKNQCQSDPSLPKAPSARGKKDVSKNDGKWAAGEKVWEFFWNSLTIGEKIRVLTALCSLVCVTSYAGYWFGGKLAESKLDRQAAESAAEKADLNTRIAALERQLAEKPEENQSTIDVARPANRSYVDFINELNVARSQGPHAVRALVDHYHKRTVKWDCVILKIATNSYWIGVNHEAEPKDWAFATFNDFDPYAKVGDRRTIEGRLSTADDSKIILYDCHFAPDSKEP